MPGDRRAATGRGRGRWPRPFAAEGPRGGRPPAATAIWISSRPWLRRSRPLAAVSPPLRRRRPLGGGDHRPGSSASSGNIGPLEVVVFQTSARTSASGSRRPRRGVFTKVWEMACFAGFSRGGARRPRSWFPRGRGTILFTGATASLRGAGGLRPPSPPPRTALRAVSQEHGAGARNPRACMWAHVICDGLPSTGVFLPVRNMPDLDCAPGGGPGAEARRHRRDLPRPAQAEALPPGTHELDLRPWDGGLVSWRG